MLTPVDIENKEFGKAFRGYDIDEVEEFLQNLVVDYEKLYRENASLKEKNAMLQETIGNYRGMEETMQNAIIAAQRTAEDIKRNAYHRAENITREAQTRANESIASADKTIQELENSYLALQGEVDAYRARMRSLLETNLKLLDDMPRVEIKSIDRVKIDPVTIESVEHTAPVPNVSAQEAAEDISRAFRPDGAFEAAAASDLKNEERMPEAGSVSMAENAFESPISSQRVPLSEKIPVAQATRGTHINPVVDRLMKEQQLQSEKSLEELNEEENAADFAVKKETVDSAGFDGSAEQEFYINVDKKKYHKHNKHNDQNGGDGAYFDVFTDNTL